MSTYMVITSFVCEKDTCISATADKRYQRCTSIRIALKNKQNKKKGKEKEKKISYQTFSKNAYTYISKKKNKTKKIIQCQYLIFENLFLFRID